MIGVVVPVADLTDAKKRLAPALSHRERAGLMSAMLIDVLIAFAQTNGIGPVYVVAHDCAILKIARAYGAVLIPEPENRGYNEAVAMAVAHLADRDLSGILVIPADVPLVHPPELESLARPVSGPLVRLAPAKDGDGSNGLLLSPPEVIATQYGPGSAARHRQAAKEIGVPCEELYLPGLSFDIDTPQDLTDFCAIPSDSKSRAFLEERGIVMRLQDSSYE
jgi:2-phospho-L-lactate guanylyltransferase